MFLTCGYSSVKVNVAKKATATRVEPGYALKDDDSTFQYKGNKYLIITNETFDKNGNIISADIAGDVGYTRYSQKEFDKYKSLLKDYSLSKTILIAMINNQNIIVNERKVNNPTIDKTNKRLFYTLNNKDTLYRITYK